MERRQHSHAGGKLDLGKIVDQMVIAAMGIDDDDLFQAVAGDLTAGVFQQVDNRFRLDANRARDMSGFEDLGEDEVREDHHRFKFCRPAAEFTANEHIGAEWQVMPVAFDAREREQADILGLFHCLRELVSSQFFPTHSLSFRTS